MEENIQSWTLYLFKEPDIVKPIKIRRLEWAEHILRASDERTTKKIRKTMPEVTRKVGKPKLRWEDCVRQDITDIGNKELEECSTEQTGMAGAFEEGQGPHRAVMPLMMMMLLMITLKNQGRLKWLLSDWQCRGPCD